MSFLNPFFLIGLAGVAVPVLIHLLTRDRVQRVAFSTLRFFVKGAKHVIRRKKFQELLLILLRVAIVALLALVFARPFLKTKAPVANQMGVTARVIVADVSGSMRRAGLPAALTKEVLAAIASLHEGEDVAALVTFADAPQVVDPLGKDWAGLKRDAGTLAPGWGGTNLGAALRKANELLRGINAKQKEIVLISDLQRAGWRDFKGDWKLASDVTLTIRAVKPTGPTASLAIVEAGVPQSLVLDKQPRSVAVRVANFSDEPKSNVVVTLALTGQKPETQSLNIRANGTAAARFRHVFDAPGDNLGTVAVAGSVFYFNARTIPQIPVLLVNGRPSANPEMDAAFFLGKALAPSAESPFLVKTVAAGQVAPADVAGAMVVVLANVGSAPAPVTDALAALLARGGGVVFLPGDQVKPETFNAQFGRVAPCRLRQILTAHPANNEPAESLTRVDFEHPIFEVFARPHYGDLSLPKFARYWETTDTQLSRVLARFGDGRPAIVERAIGNGVSVALVSAIDPAWNDFAYQSVFLPFLHQTVRYLAVRTERRTGYTSGEMLPVPAGGTLQDPAGQSHPATEAFAAEPGNYFGVNQNGNREFVYAVNANLTEADPTTVAAEVVTAAIERAPGELAGTLDADTGPAVAGAKKDTGWWWWLLCGLVGLTMVELAVGNRTMRH